MASQLAWAQRGKNVSWVGERAGHFGVRREDALRQVEHRTAAARVEDHVGNPGNTASETRPQTCKIWYVFGTRAITDR